MRKPWQRCRATWTVCAAVWYAHGRDNEQSLPRPLACEVHACSQLPTVHLVQAMQHSAAGAESTRRIAALVQAALLLREALAALPALAGALAPAQSELLKAVRSKSYAQDRKRCVLSRTTMLHCWLALGAMCPASA